MERFTRTALAEGRPLGEDAADESLAARISKAAEADEQARLRKMLDEAQPWLGSDVGVMAETFVNLVCRGDGSVALTGSLAGRCGVHPGPDVMTARGGAESIVMTLPAPAVVETGREPARAWRGRVG